MSWLMPRGLFTFTAWSLVELPTVSLISQQVLLSVQASTSIGRGQTNPNGTPECSQQATAQIFISLVLQET